MTLKYFGKTTLPDPAYSVAGSSKMRGTKGGPTMLCFIITVVILVVLIFISYVAITGNVLFTAFTMGDGCCASAGGALTAGSTANPIPFGESNVQYISAFDTTGNVVLEGITVSGAYRAFLNPLFTHGGVSFRVDNGNVEFLNELYTKRLITHDDISIISDARRKKDILPIDSKYALDVILGLKPVNYQYIPTATTSVDDSEQQQQRIHSGFIAQDIQKLSEKLPGAIEDVVRIEKNASSSSSYLSVNYIQIIPFITAALQEQQSEIKALQEEMRIMNENFKDFYNNNNRDCPACA